MSRVAAWPRRRLIAVGVALLVVATGLVIWRVVRDDDRSRIAEALDLAPASATRLSWTDWAGVRRELGADLTLDSPTDEVEDFLLEAYDRDLSGNSALEESAPTTHEELGFSPASIDWELFAQGNDGAIVIMGLPDGFDYDRLRDQLGAVGFTKPDEADGVWVGGVDLLEGLSGPVTPELAALQIDEEAGVLYGSDELSTLEERAKAAEADRDEGITDAVAALASPLSAAVYDGDYTCAELSMVDAAAPDRTRAAELVEAAGGVHPLAGFAIAAQPGGKAQVAMSFETAEQARADADVRRDLASGPAPGQGGTFSERFSLKQVTATDRVITMDLAPIEGWQVVSDLNHGPVLFATC